MSRPRSPMHAGRWTPAGPPARHSGQENRPMSHSDRSSRIPPGDGPHSGQTSSLDVVASEDGHAEGPVSEGGPSPAPTESPDPFDPARYRLDTDYASMLGATEHILEVPVRNPGKESWFRVHPTNRM